MRLTDIAAEVTDRRRCVTVFAPTLSSGLAKWFDTRDVEVVHRLTAESAAEPAATVTEGDRCLGWVELSPVAVERRSDTTPQTLYDDVGYRDLLSLLSETRAQRFAAHHLDAMTHEYADRAWRCGEGTLYVGLGRTPPRGAAATTYSLLAMESDVDVHLYGAAGIVAEVPGPAIHPGARSVRFVAYDGGGDDDQKCAFVAEERGAGYTGFWSHRPETVDSIVEPLETERLD
jgi:hypothetical protein